MFKLKLLISGVILLGSVGAYAYVKYLQTENAVLTANNITQELALDQIEAELKLRNKDLEIKQSQVAKKQKQLSNLGAVNSKLQGVLNEMSKEVGGCLDVKPGDEFIDQLLEYSKGQNSSQD